MNNQIRQEIVNIQEQSDANYLRRYLRQCEDKILSLTYDEYNRLCFCNTDQIWNQIEIRKVILNRMFELNFSETSLADLKKTNQRLIKMENKVKEIHIQSIKQMSYIYDDFKLDTCLYYDHDAQSSNLSTKEDDDNYVSQWSDIIEVISMINGDNMTDSLYFCSGNFYDSYISNINKKVLRDIDLAIPQPISFCYSLCELCNNQHYSIPDILRMNTYRVRQESFIDRELDVDFER